MHWRDLVLQVILILFLSILIISAFLLVTHSDHPKREGSVDMLIEPQNRHKSMQSSELNADAFSCIDPAQRLREQCVRFEQHILKSVVRFDVEGPSLEDPNLLVREGGHGTIIDGRFIVIHNHSTIDLSDFADEAYKEKASLNLYGANGYLLLRDARPPLFEIVFQDQEMLVLDFGTNDEGEGYFDWYRVPSAQFKNYHELTIQPGSEVAQVNWDGQVTFIEWVKVLAVITQDGVPRLIIDNPINEGSSGGGIFWNGVHIANNWKIIGHFDDSGKETYQYSIAVLNSVSDSEKFK